MKNPNVTSIQIVENDCQGMPINFRHSEKIPDHDLGIGSIVIFCLEGEINVQGRNLSPEQAAKIMIEMAKKVTK